MTASIVSLWVLGPGLVSAQGTPTDQLILRHQRALQRNPTDARAYYRLGDACVQKARETGDVGYFVLAERALRKSLDLAPRQSGALRHLAYVLYARHEFREAAAYARRAIELDGSDGHAYGILGDAHLEVGEYAEAEVAYRRMAETDGDLYSGSRLAGLKSLRGDVEGAIADLSRAIDAGRASRRPAEAIAWAQWQLGNERFGLGDLAGAEDAYRAALETYARYHRALAGLAQVRAAHGRYPEAVELYQQAIAAVPQPDYVAALGDLYARLGRRDDARRQYELVEYIGRLNALNQALYNRELAYFYADHDVKLEEALGLARRELDVRRDVYAYDVLAWALVKNGQPAAARAAMAEALRLGTRDARLFFHAGVIEHRLGHRESAAGHLRRALATNPSFHILHADEARRLLAQIEPGGDGAPPEGPRNGE